MLAPTSSKLAARVDVVDMDRCLACGCGLKKGDRRLIGSTAKKHVIPLLCDVSRHATAPEEVDVEKLSTGYICRGYRMKSTA